MRTVILIPQLHAGAELALNRLLKQRDLDIIGVVQTNLSPLEKPFWKHIRYAFKKSGVIYGLLIALTYHLHLLGLFIGSLIWWNRKRKWKTCDELVKKHLLLFHKTSNINQAESLELLNSWGPDVIVSLYFDQILKQPALTIAKKATINMHPGILPNYKGLWAGFWKLYHREKKAGVTIHLMEEGIDEGETLAQITYPIDRHDTALSLLLKSAHYGSKALIRILKNIKQGKPIKKLSLKGTSKYFSLPKREEIEAFHSMGKRFFNWTGLIKDLKRFY